jgi:hypothetical protein
MKTQAIARSKQAVHRQPTTTNRKEEVKNMKSRQFGVLRSPRIPSLGLLTMAAVILAAQITRAQDAQVSYNGIASQGHPHAIWLNAKTWTDMVGPVTLPDGDASYIVNAKVVLQSGDPAVQWGGCTLVQKDRPGAQPITVDESEALMPAMKFQNQWEYGYRTTIALQAAICTADDSQGTISLQCYTNAGGWAELASLIATPVSRININPDVSKYNQGTRPDVTYSPYGNACASKLTPVAGP